MFDKVRVSLGEGFLDRYTIFESKRFFSIYLHVFNTIKQDRLHSHAFNGLAFVLKGGYEEEYRDTDGTLKRTWIGKGIRYIPKSYTHRLLESKANSISILFTGPWDRTWTEENDRWVRTLTWGRKEVSRSIKEPIEN